MCVNDVCMLNGHMPDRCTDPATMRTHEEAPGPDSEQQEPPVFREAHLWIDGSHDDPEGPVHILNILQHLLKDMRHCKTARSFKLIMELMAITQFVHLHTKLTDNPRCQSPAKTTSLIAARRLGKGPYFAHKIWEIEAHVLKHHALPHSKPHS